MRKMLQKRILWANNVLYSNLEPNSIKTEIHKIFQSLKFCLKAQFVIKVFFIFKSSMLFNRYFILFYRTQKQGI